VTFEYSNFKALVKDKERQNIDFKLTCNAFASKNLEPKAELIRDICAMANNGNIVSHIIIGVSDDCRSFQSVKNRNLTDDNIQTLVKDSIRPPPKVTLSWCCWPRAGESHRGKDFLVIQIGPHARQAFCLARDFIAYSEKVCLRRNEVWIRRGATTDLATPEEVALLVQGKKPPTDRDMFVNTQYDRLPRGEQRKAVVKDLYDCVQNLKGQMCEEQRIILPIRGLPFVWRYSIEDKITSRFPISYHAATDWHYEHALLYIVLETVSKSTLRVYGKLNFKEKWGQFMTYSVISNPYGRNFVAAPANTTDTEFAIFTLPNVKDTEALRSQLILLHEFLESSNEIYKTLKLERKTLNTNLRRWLWEGWFRPTGQYYNRHRHVPEPLEKGQFFDHKTGQIMYREMELPNISAAKTVLDLSGWKYKVRRQRLTRKSRQRL
jgi:hypothetical protein